jgi:hypothetical protein
MGQKIFEAVLLEGVGRIGGMILVFGMVASLLVRTVGGQTPTGTAMSSAGTANQGSSATMGCPGGNGIHIVVNSGTATDSASSINTVIDERRSLDTTIVFNVAQKTWTRTNLAAAITAGLADQTRGGYAICAGVTAMMPSATLTINGARGRVHFAATLQNLLNAIRLGPGGVSPQPRRL